MVYTYTPTYYSSSSSFQDTLTSLCKSILLPFSLKNIRRLPADQKMAKQQTDNLKWQQESFHKILNLIGLQKEGIVPETEVSAFRSHLLDTLIASPKDQEPPGFIRDKLLFLQELLYAKCISADEYHSWKRPLLQRLAVQGVEIDCRDVVVGDSNNITAVEKEEWSVIELREKEEVPIAVEKTKTPIKSLFNWKGKKDNEKATNADNGSSILTPEAKRKPFRALFDKEERDDEAANPKSAKKQWGFDGLKKWKRSGTRKDDESDLLYGEKSEKEDSVSSCTLVASPIGKGPDTKRIRKQIHSDGSSSDFFIDKVLGDNIKKELSRIQSELNATTNPNLNLSDDQMEAISTRLPVDKADLNDFFPKSWCDKYGDVVLDVVRKEFKDHVGEMENLRNAAKEKDGGLEGWVDFEESGDENHHPNLFFREDHRWLNQSDGGKLMKDAGGGCFVNNPFVDVDYQNPFWG